MVSQKLKTAAKYVAPAVLALAVPLVAGYEGLRLRAYADPVGIYTICYGETLGVKMGQTATQAECWRQLQARLGDFAAQVDTLVIPSLPVERQVALTSFAYNAGIDNFAHSRLLAKLNTGDVVGACNELPRWVYAKGVKLPGLVKRRESERQLCLKGI